MMTKREVILSETEQKIAVYKMLNEMDDRRERAERFQENFSRADKAPTFHPSYEAEEVDDGRLDPVVRTGFVPVTEIRNSYRKESWAEALMPVEVVETIPALSVAEGPASQRSGGPASRRKYVREYQARIPKRIEIRRPNGELTAYRPDMLQR